VIDLQVDYGIAGRRKIISPHPDSATIPQYLIPQSHTTLFRREHRKQTHERKRTRTQMIGLTHQRATQEPETSTRNNDQSGADVSFSLDPRGCCLTLVNCQPVLDPSFGPRLCYSTIPCSMAGWAPAPLWRLPAIMENTLLGPFWSGRID